MHVIDRQSPSARRKHRSLRFRSQQFEIIRYGWRRNFYTQACSSTKKVLRSSARVSAQTQPVGCAQRKSPQLASPRPGASNFLPLAPSTENQCCASHPQREALERLSRDQVGGRHHLHALPGPGSIQHASRANVKMEGSRSSPQSNSSDDPEHSHLPTLSNLVKARRPDETAGICTLCGRQCSPRCIEAKVAE